MLWQGSGELDALPDPALHGPEVEQRGVPGSATVVEEAAAWPGLRLFMNVIEPKPVSLASHSVTLSNLPLEERRADGSNGARPSKRQ